MKALLAAALLLAAIPAGAQTDAPDVVAKPAAPDLMDAMIRQAVAKAHLQIKPAAAPQTQQEIDAARENARQRGRAHPQSPLPETPLPQ